MSYYSLGLDLGSRTLKLVVIDQNKSIIYDQYKEIREDSISVLIEVIQRLAETLGSEIPFKGTFIVGSGKGVILTYLDINHGSEIFAQAKAASEFFPSVRTIVEIGGQDSKLILLDAKGKISDFRMNELCAAGTGAFWEREAARLGIPISKLGDLALKSQRPVHIAGRCAVFARTEAIHLQQDGVPLPDILYGLSLSLVRTYLGNLVRGKELLRPILFQGGVAANKGIIRAFKALLNLKPEEFIIPPKFRVMGAYGAAILGLEKPSLRPITPLMLLKVFSFSKKKKIRTEASPLKPSKIPLLAPTKLKDSKEIFLGIDLGSVSIKAVGIDKDNKICLFKYLRIKGNPLKITQSFIQWLEQKIDKRMKILAVGVTGSGRELLAHILDTDLMINEIIAQAHAAYLLDPKIDTIFEIGGLDSKYIYLENGRLSLFEMNRVCAAGVGAFLEEQSKVLGIRSLEELSRFAFKAQRPVKLGTKCSVFMESDLIHYQRQGVSKEELAAGLCISVVQNFLENVVGEHKIGKKVLITGGLGVNPAVISAFERELKREVLIHPYPLLSGAIAAANIAKEKWLKKPSLKNVLLKVEEFSSSQFECKFCENLCRIQRININKKTALLGGMCDRYDKKYQDKTSKDLFKARMELMLRSPLKNQGKIRIGIPRALLFFDFFPLWKTFFEGLNFQVVVSSASNRSLLEQGLKKATCETCLPLKALLAHILDLEKKKVDYIFVPNILDNPSSPDGRNVYCPYIQAGPQFVQGLTKIPLLCPFISEEFESNAHLNALREIGIKFGIKESTITQALNKAKESYLQFIKSRRELGKEVLNSFKNTEEIVVLIGKPYVLYDPFMSGNLARIVQRLGYRVIPLDLLPISNYTVPEEFNCLSWVYQKDFLRAALYIRENPKCLPVFVSNFGCGPDPFIIRYFKKILGKKPCLFIEIDEHIARQGLKTRIEAYLSGVLKAEESSGKSASILRSSSRKVLYIPYLSDLSYGFAAALRSIGIEARVLPMSDQVSIELGKKYLIGGECHPYVLALGDYIKKAKDPEFEKGEAFFYMIGTDACRLGQYKKYISMVGEDLGLCFPVVTNLRELLGDQGVSKRLQLKVWFKTWQSMNIFDLLFQKLLEVRPFELVFGSADKAYIRARQIICKGIAEDRVYSSLLEAIKELERVKTREYEPRPIIAIVGDYFTRINPFANQDIFRHIEKLGGQVWIQPTFTDVVKFQSCERLDLLKAKRKWLALLRHVLFHRSLLYKEAKVKELFKGRVKNELPLDWNFYKEKVGLYMDFRMPKGLVGPIGGVIEHIEKGVQGVLNLITLNCNYGTVVTAVLMRVCAQFKDIPFLTLIYEGLKPTNVITRLEAFMAQVKSEQRTI